MSNQLSIYLSGSIKKGKSDNRDSEDFWTPAHENLISSLLGESVRLLNPAKTQIRRSDYHANYGCDLAMVEIADYVLVDLRRERGIGVGAELMFAQIKSIPVVGWAPRNSQYRRDFVEDVFGEDLQNWIHPFAFGLCDYLEETLELCCYRLRQLASEAGPTKRTPSPDAAIAYFRRLYPREPF